MTTTISQRSHRRRGWWWWTRRVLVGLVALLLILASIVFVAGARAKANLRTEYPAPGQLVDVGGYLMHIYCQGEGTPTVLMEAGQGEFSLTWSLVYPEVARSTRVCVYDRGGFGWSHPSPKPRTAQEMVEELHTLLVKAEVRGPYVLVGHSLGGMLMRVYAHEYAEEVVGMVLVDSAHEEQVLRFPESVQEATRQLEEQMQQQLGFFRILATAGIIALNPTQVPVQSKLPQVTAETYQALLASNGQFFATLSDEISAIAESTAQVRAMQIDDLGNIPLVVLTHGQADDLFPAIINLSSEARQQMEQVWQDLQNELAALSPNSQLLVAEQSGHYIQLDQPDLVIDAILQVLAAAAP